jgi:CNT family concentrative nucleoside transporter
MNSPLICVRTVQSYLYVLFSCRIAELQSIMASDNPLSYRAWIIAQYSLCGFANLGSVGIQIGVLSALAPSRAKIIARVAFSAMICGFIS